MKKAVLLSILTFLVISVGWHVFEFIWDRDLFSQGKTEMSVINVGAREAQSLIEEREDLQIVDVRPERSYNSNRIPGAKNVSYGRGEVDVGALGKLNPEKPILIYCDGGFRSRLSLGAFEEAGFEEIFHLHRGILSWRMRGLECEQGDVSAPSE